MLGIKKIVGIIIPMQQWLKKRLTKLFENIESIITTVIVFALISGAIGILALSKKALNCFLHIVNTPTPLWATIALVLLLGGYIYLKKPKFHPFSSPTTTLPKYQKDILLYLLNHVGDTLTFETVNLLNTSEDIAKYHLQELHKKQFISEGLPVLQGQQSWLITDKGKKYLIENRLIT